MHLEQGKANGQLAKFEFWDKDNDGFIDIYEVCISVFRLVWSSPKVLSLLLIEEELHLIYILIKG